jgi:hypothetical protein
VTIDWLRRHLVGLNVIDIVFSGIGLVCLTRGLVRRGQHRWSRRSGMVNWKQIREASARVR